MIESNLRSFGEHRQDAFGDAFLRDVTDCIGRADSRTRLALAAAHIAYARGRALCANGDREMAGTAFSAALKTLTANGSR